MALNINDYGVPSVKPLPVFLLLDGSGSMSQNQKIDTLNKAVSEMLGKLAEDTVQYENSYLVTVIIFSGDQAEVVMQALPAGEANCKWRDIPTRGRTPLGSALTLTKKMLEDRDIIPSKSYRPTLILVSDGIPTDDWQQPLESLVTEGRSAKCDRMAVLIGKENADASSQVLKLFIGDMPHKVEKAETAGQLLDFFQRATMTVTTRTHSVNPNQIVPMTAAGAGIDGDDIMFF
ncbi:vWA domain-containing protein [Selenomonas ruminantium]|uniref:Uncharacterized conserved protein YegL, contains vWA domain of TerY type n=1 Tax=Selenomonas ruminantium TaxID=971 RepID=A0A1K1NKW8_SELRU|nr:VWA domain-containing protein [Selenomonas ruminantium]SFW36122.1 Uncharacterized conserved protein YegL, contains vWA domain of TerY type [Selenomonas ruminantium]